jgi:hypothetical protein
MQLPVACVPLRSYVIYHIFNTRMINVRPVGPKISGGVAFVPNGDLGKIILQAAPKVAKYQ